MSFLDNFKIIGEKEDCDEVAEVIENGIEFKGTNLWILVFAIFIASLGLNVNSTAVIIGAMLVSPLMGPIMGLGFGMAVNDLHLLRKSLSNYLFAAGVGIATSTIFFAISPLNEARSEILARTSPNIYDVLIALFGGLAGMLATSSRLKGNVIPGVAIATALMPPLCTIGYGLATLKMKFVFGATYLFIINTVFIALATLLTTRLLKFPYKHLPQKEDEVKAKRIVFAVVIITILPSLYFGYDIVRQGRFTEKANRFIDQEANLPNDYLLKRSIDPKTKNITLVYGGAPIDSNQIKNLQSKLKSYDLPSTKLDIKQGFAYLQDNKDQEGGNLSMALNEKERQLMFLQNKLDSLGELASMNEKIFRELKAQQQDVVYFSIQPATRVGDNSQSVIWMGLIISKRPIPQEERRRIEAWLKLRVSAQALYMSYQSEQLSSDARGDHSK